MIESYGITVDQKRGLVSLTFRGVWTEAIMDAFERDLNAERAKMTRAGLSPDWPCVLIDLTAFPVQTQAVASRLHKRVGAFHTDRRIAFVGGESQLLQMQLRRVAAIEDHRFFAARVAALAWLQAADPVIDKRCSYADAR